jgi:hypothetical protein
LTIGPLVHLLRPLHIRTEAKTRMSLAPIRGAPPGAPNPDFPTKELDVQSAQPAVASSSTAEQSQVAAKRQRGTPIQVHGEGNILTLRVIPELPAISRASMTIHIDSVGSSSPYPLGFVRMSAASARTFLNDLRNARSPIVARGDEDGTVQIEFEAAESGVVFSAFRLNEPEPLCRCPIDRAFDTKSMADDLLGDLGA